MPENMADIILFAVIFAFMSVTYIASGLRILTAKKPFIVNLRHQIILNAPTVASILYIVWPKYPQQSLLPMRYGDRGNDSGLWNKFVAITRRCCDRNVW